MKASVRRKGEADWKPVTVEEALKLDKNSSLFRCDACYREAEPVNAEKAGPYFRHVGGDEECAPTRNRF